MLPTDGDSTGMESRGGGRPSEIQAEHLTRFAIVLVRQSSPTQVRENTGSTDVQRGLADLARQLGWAEELILTIDDDLGISGKIFEGRSGFRRMCDLMEEGRVGLVLVSEIDRLSREPFAGEYFLRRAIRHRVLLWAKEKLYAPDPARLAELFNLRIQVLLGWWDNEARRERFTASKRARLAKGFAVSKPPRGFVQRARGEWAKDPDPDVREAMGRIPSLYRRLLSIRKVVRHCHEHGWRFPRRIRGELRWDSVTPMHIAHLLRNPLYTDAYVYHRLSVKAADDFTPRSVTKRPRSEWVVVRGHHEGYLTWEEWEEIQELLSSRRVTHHPPTGNGPALVQGIIYCAPCDRAIRTVYNARYKRRVGTQRLPSYVCKPADRFGTFRRCFSAASMALDKVVEQEIFNALAPPSLRAALAVIAEVAREQTQLARAQQRWIQQADEAVEDARRRYLGVDEGNPMVKVDMETRLQVALRHKQEVEAECAKARREWTTPLDHKDALDLLARAADLPALWATVSNEDRKRLVQTVIRRVWVHRKTEDATEIEIEWPGGLRQRCAVFRRPGVEEQVAELFQRGCREASNIVRLCGPEAC